jgi:wobble nucleotide-excising tRNase
MQSLRWSAQRWTHQQGWPPMIRRLQRVKAFGSFHDFSWPTGLHEFRKFNLLFGWNYSGKTTFSRTFRCFELQKYHEDFGTAEVQFCVEDGTAHSLSSITAPHVFRVFNVDFVRENLGFDSGSAEAILILGAEDIAKQADLAKKLADHLTGTEQLKANRESKSNQRTELETFLTFKAKEIKTNLNYVNYDRTKFEPRVLERKDDFASYILDDNAVQQSIDVYRSKDKKAALTASSISLTSVSTLRTETATLLARTVIANAPLSRLTSNAELETWVKQGRPLHQGKNDCQFCESALPNGFFESLESHFSADYDDLIAKLDKHITKLKNAKIEKVSLDHKSDFYFELQDQFVNAEEALQSLLEDRRAALETLIQAAKQKQLKAFTAVPCPDVVDNASDMGNLLVEINALITAHNKRTSDFESNRDKAFTTLENHYAAIFAKEHSYAAGQQGLTALQVAITNQINELGEVQRDLNRLQRELSDAAKGAEQINDFLRSYFGKEDLKITVTADQRFQITRNAVAAKNLSEGERTAVAFAYFMTRVLDGQHPISDTTVIIDDPIGSLDTHHLFHTYGLISTKLADCFQLFVLTHNFEFFNLFKGWALRDERGRGKNQAGWQKWSVYLIRRKDNGHSFLQSAPPELIKFNSEYHYLFSTLYHFDASDDPGFEYIMSLPNIARRFLEGFCGTMIPTQDDLEVKLQRMFRPEEAVKVLKFLHHYSHHRSTDRSLVIPEMSECKEVIASCLTAVKTWNPDYYRDLEASIQ